MNYDSMLIEGIIYFINNPIDYLFYKVKVHCVFISRISPFVLIGRMSVVKLILMIGQ